MKFKGKRTGIGFTIGTILVIMCLYFTKDEPQNLQGILFTWVGIFGVFVGKNLANDKIKGGEDEQ